MNTTIPSRASNLRTFPAPAAPRRLLSLDVLRGITIAFMIMVNNNADNRAWPFMQHADWNGMTATDLVFPTFLFLVGASIVFAYEARLAKGATRAQLAWQTIRRAALLFCFGLIVNGFPYFHFATYRIYGVLQRIAICYCIAGLFYLWDRRWQSKLAVAAAALIGYWILMRWVPVPGLGVPGPSSSGHAIPFLDKDANLVAWLDRHIFPGRLYEGTRDPEGLLSNLPSLATALLGMLAGIWLRTTHTLRGKATGLAGAAATCLALGSLWSLWFPLNKKLWTSSYVLVAAGIALALWALLYWAIEVMGAPDPTGPAGSSPATTPRSKWLYPWLVLGSNSIAAYMISELLDTALNLVGTWIAHRRFSPLGWLYTHTFAAIPNAGLASFAYSFTYLAICFIPVWFLYRNKIFLKV
jgi:predicted acyltransferase